VRTTLDLPDPVFRDLKMKAVQDGVSLKDLVRSFVEKCLYESSAPPVTPVRSPLPEFLPRKGGAPIPALTNAEIEEIFLREDLEKMGYDLSKVKGSIFDDQP
jgi:hypothetical protein